MVARRCGQGARSVDIMTGAVQGQGVPGVSIRPSSFARCDVGVNDCSLDGRHESTGRPLGPEALCRDAGEGPGPAPPAPQARPEAEADGVSSMISPDTGVRGSLSWLPYRDKHLESQAAPCTIMRESINYH